MFDYKKDFKMGIESTQVQFPFINNSNYYIIYKYLYNELSFWSCVSAVNFSIIRHICRSLLSNTRGWTLNVFTRHSGFSLDKRKYWGETYQGYLLWILTLLIILFLTISWLSYLLDMVSSKTIFASPGGRRQALARFSIWEWK